MIDDQAILMILIIKMTVDGEYNCNGDTFAISLEKKQRINHSAHTLD